MLFVTSPYVQELCCALQFRFPMKAHHVREHAFRRQLSGEEKATLSFYTVLFLTGNKDKGINLQPNIYIGVCIYIYQLLLLLILFIYIFCYCCLVIQSCPTLLRPHGLCPARLLYPWDFPGKNTRMGCHFLLQGNFLIQGLKLDLLHWQVGSLLLSHLGSPFPTIK